MDIYGEGFYPMKLALVVVFGIIGFLLLHNFFGLMIGLVIGFVIAAGK